MVQAYSPPGFTIEFQQSQTVASPATVSRDLVIMGEGNTTLSITGQIVARGAGDYDSLTNEYVAVSINKCKSLDGTILYSTPQMHLSSISSTDFGIVWDASAPALNTNYVVNWTRNKVNADYVPVRFTNSLEAYVQYGQPTTTDGVAVSNPISLAIDLAFAGGAGSVVGLQINPNSGGTDAAKYADALSKLEEEDGVYYIVPLSTDSGVRSEVLAHVAKMSTPDQSGYRTAWWCPASTTTVSDYVALASAIRAGYILPDTTSVGERTRIIAPPQCVTAVTGTDLISSYNVTVASYFAAAALAGNEASKSPASTLTDVVAARISSLKYPAGATKYKKSELNRLGGAGILAMVSNDTVQMVTVRDSRTADPTSVVSSDPAAVAIKDYTAYTVAKSLITKYKNARNTNDTMTFIATDLKTILTSLCDSTTGVLNGFSEDSVLRDPTDPRRVIVSYKINPVLSIREIIVRYGVDLSLF